MEEWLCRPQSDPLVVLPVPPQPKGSKPAVANAWKLLPSFLNTIHVNRCANPKGFSVSRLPEETFCVIYWTPGSGLLQVGIIVLYDTILYIWVSFHPSNYKENDHLHQSY